MFCSVVVPVYNAENYIRKCIESILTQNQELMEVILVNDGSKDNSGNICREYAEKYNCVKVIEKENGGHTSARNAGLSAARGKYIIFVDSDDWVSGNLVEDCYKIASENDEPDMVLYGQYHLRGGNVIDKAQPYEPGFYSRERIEKEILPTLLEKGRFALHERMTKRELIIKAQECVDKRLKIGEDLVSCVWAVSRSNSIYVSENNYYHYLIHESSISHSMKNYYYDDWIYVKQILDAHLKDVLPDYERQLGVCSIRFLDRAVTGEIERNGLAPSNIRKIKRRLYDFDRELRSAKTSKKAIRIKLFCLKHRMIYVLHFANTLIRKKRERN